MNYCPRCKTMHNDEDLCPVFKGQLKKDPQLLNEAAKFTTVAGQYHLVSSQALNEVAKVVNNLAGTNLAFEGSHQMARDVQVFRQLNVDAYCGKSQVFASAESSQQYFLNGSDGQISTLIKKLNGTGQEVDWLRFKQGQLESVIKRTELLGEYTTNAPGVDGESVCRFTGKVLERTTVKAAQDSKNLGTNISDVLEALKKGTLDPNDTLAGIEGTKDALKKALEKNISRALENGDAAYAEKLTEALNNLNVVEINTPERIKESTNRLMEKIKQGHANNVLSAEQVAGKALQGAVIGAVVALSVSTITNYLKYRNGELTLQEATRDVGLDSTKGALIGAAMGAISCFLPAGTLGFIGGMAIGVYVNAVTQNLLDEIFGKGAFEAILNSAGYTYGMAINLSSVLQEIEKNQKKFNSNINVITQNSSETEKLLNQFDSIIKG